MINIEIAKFMFKFNNQMLPDFFNDFTKLDNVHNYNTRQKTRAEFLQYAVASKSRKTLLYIGLRWGKMYQKNFVIAHFQLLKISLKQIPC